MDVSASGKLCDWMIEKARKPPEMGFVLPETPEVVLVAVAFGRCRAEERVGNALGEVRKRELVKMSLAWSHLSISPRGRLAL